MSELDLCDVLASMKDGECVGTGVFCMRLAFRTGFVRGVYEMRVCAFYVQRAGSESLPIRISLVDELKIILTYFIVYKPF